MTKKLKRTLIINTGGESRRIKESLASQFSKSWVTIAKEPIIIHNLKSLGSEVQEIIIVTRNDEELVFFKSKLNSFSSSLEFPIANIKLLVDDKNSQISGPLRGLLAAINHCQTEIIWWIPSDHPYINSNLFFMLESKLSKSNIVSIYDNEKLNDLHFEPQIFVTSKSTIKKYSFFTFNRITDIYRIIPDIIFIAPSNMGEKRSLIGINTLDDLELANSNNIEYIKEKNKLILINRFCILNNDLTEIRNRADTRLLLDNSQYFLLKRMIELQTIEDKNISLSELTYLEWKFWKNKNKIIAVHCGKDYLKMNEIIEKRKNEIEDFMKKFKLNS